jgi:hypothetical protein
MNDSPLSANDQDYFTGHYSGLLAYALSERLGWPVIYYSVDDETRWRSATVQAPNGAELSATGIAPQADGFGVGRRIATAADMELLRSYYEKTTVRAHIDRAADALAAFAEPGMNQI